MHFRVQNCQNFRLRRANEPHTFGVGEPAAGGEKIDFWRSFWWIFMIYFPPIIRTHGGGEIFTSPPISEGHGGEIEKVLPPHHGGEKSSPGLPLVSLTLLPAAGGKFRLFRNVSQADVCINFRKVSLAFAENRGPPPPPPLSKKRYHGPDPPLKKNRAFGAIYLH